MCPYAPGGAHDSRYNCAGVLQAGLRATQAIASLTRVSHMAVPKVKEQENTLNPLVGGITESDRKYHGPW